MFWRAADKVVDFMYHFSRAWKIASRLQGAGYVFTEYLCAVAEDLENDTGLPSVCREEDCACDCERCAPKQSGSSTEH